MPREFSRRALAIYAKLDQRKFKKNGNSLMYILGLDLETTGLDVEKDQIIELGAVVWHVEERRPCLFFNALLRPTIPLPQNIIELTGITEDYLRQFSMETKSAYNALNLLMGKCDYVVAHNGNNFDKPFYTLASNLAVG